MWKNPVMKQTRKLKRAVISALISSRGQPSGSAIEHTVTSQKGQGNTSSCRREVEEEGRRRRASNLLSMQVGVAQTGMRPTTWTWTGRLRRGCTKPGDVDAIASFSTGDSRFVLISLAFNLLLRCFVCINYSYSSLNSRF